jgi:hypothetical protein
LRISLLERCWPLAIADLLGLRTHFAFLRGRPAECRIPPLPLPARIICRRQQSLQKQKGPPGGGPFCWRSSARLRRRVRPSIS